MFDNFKIYNYSRAQVSPEGYGRPFGASLSGNIINGFECVIGTGLQVVLKPGNAVLPNGSGGTASSHLVSLLADFTMTAATADASNPRIDAVVLYVDTSSSLPSGTPTAANLDGIGVPKAKIVTGTPNASPVAPNDTAIKTSIGSTSYPYTVVWTGRVNAGAASLSQTNLTDTRVFAAPTNTRALGASSYIDNGGVASFTNGTLNGAITAGTALINVNGVMVPQPFNSLSVTMAASKDRYYYVTLGNSTIQAATDATNGGVAPTLPAKSVWVAKFISGASITSVQSLSGVLDANSWTVTTNNLGKKVYTKRVTQAISLTAGISFANYAIATTPVDVGSNLANYNASFTTYLPTTFRHVTTNIMSTGSSIELGCTNMYSGGTVSTTANVTLTITEP